MLECLAEAAANRYKWVGYNHETFYSVLGLIFFGLYLLKNHKDAAMEAITKEKIFYIMTAQLILGLSYVAFFNNFDAKNLCIIIYSLYNYMLSSESVLFIFILAALLYESHAFIGNNDSKIFCIIILSFLVIEIFLAFNVIFNSVVLILIFLLKIPFVLALRM